MVKIEQDPENPVWKKVYYIFLFLKVSQCKFKQKETIFKARKPLQKQVKIHQIQNRLVCFTPAPPTGVLPWIHWGTSDSNFLCL